MDNIFNSIDHLEGPKCPKCGAKIDYGLTTEWSDDVEAHICCSCGQVLK